MATISMTQKQFDIKLQSFQSKYDDLVANVGGIKNQYSVLGASDIIHFTFMLEYPKLLNINVMPALRLDINPKTMDIDRKHIINRTQTLGGWIEEYWGMEMPVISCSGNSGAFIHPKYGLTVVNRRSSRSFQVFLALIRIMEENALVYNEKGQVTDKGIVRLQYDNNYFSGHFESFDFEESADNPFSIEYSFSFKVESENIQQFNDIKYANNYQTA